MKNLHWVIVLLVVLALLGLPAWYALNGVGAQAIPVAAATGTGDDTNRGTPGSCLLYTSPSPRDGLLSRMPSSA